jgi:hypothetical protein
MRQNQKVSTFEEEPISWWSWRPGIKPRNALIIGGLLSIVALLLASLGLITLVLGIVDSVSQPLIVPGVVTEHIANSFDGQPRLRIRLHTAGFPDEILPVVTDAVFHAIHDNDAVLLNYSQNLHMLYALQSNGQRYALTTSETAGIYFGAVVLLLFGMALLFYPLVLANWGWRDLYRQGEHVRRRAMTATVVGLRAALQTRAGRPGLTPRPVRTWYGVALCPTDISADKKTLTFAISEEAYKSLHRGDIVHITYSPHLHYVYALEPVES